MAAGPKPMPTDEIGVEFLYCWPLGPTVEMIVGMTQTHSPAGVRPYLRELVFQPVQKTASIHLNFSVFQGIQADRLRIAGRERRA